MRKLTKILLGSCMIAATTISLASTTYAFVVLNDQVEVEEFDFNLDVEDGILISIDGENFRSIIEEDLIKKAIVAKMNDINVLEDSRLESPVLTPDYVDTEYNKIFLRETSTKDLTTFTTVDPYTHLTKSANKNDYIQFDLWFRIESSEGAIKDYDLSFVDKTRSSESPTGMPYLEAEDQTVEINNSFRVGGTDYNSGEIVTINPRNAMRIGVTKQSSAEENDIVIFEPYEGMGSYAIHGPLDEEDYIDAGVELPEIFETPELIELLDTKYDPEDNFMYQYLRSYSGYMASLSFTDAEIYTNTIKSFDNVVSLGEFKPVDTRTYNDVKITVSIWQEGYDADCVAGVGLSNVKCYLSFFASEKTGGTE